jgi:quinol monooxygenase YgiN
LGSGAEPVGDRAYRVPVTTSISQGLTNPGGTRAELYALHEGPDRLVMIEKYESEQALSEHSKNATLADLMSALEGKLSNDLDAQVLLPHPAGNAQSARSDRFDARLGERGSRHLLKPCH